MQPHWINFYALVYAVYLCSTLKYVHRCSYNNFSAKTELEYTKVRSIGQCVGEYNGALKAELLAVTGGMLKHYFL